MIQYALSSRRMPHAYIFHGPEGVGRELFAERLARILLCEEPVPSEHDRMDACGKCRACEMSVAGAHPDMHTIYRALIKQHPDAQVRARKGIDLGIDVIRRFVIDKVANKPAMGRAKVFVIREVERMSPAAQNALLKTLEEPPATTFLLLISASLDALLPTVRSRCQTVPFGLLPEDFIVERMLATCQGATEEQVRLCAGSADGSLGVAMRNWDDGLMHYHERMSEIIETLRQQGVTEPAKRIIDDAKEFAQGYRKREPEVSDTESLRWGLKALLSLVASELRHRLHVCAGALQDDGEPDAAPTTPLTPRRAADAINVVAQAERQLDLNANTQLCIEGLLIRLSRLVGT